MVSRVVWVGLWRCARGKCIQRVANRNVMGRFALVCQADVHSERSWNGGKSNNLVDQDFQWVSGSYVGSIWGQVRLPCGYVGAILGPTSVILGLCSRLQPPSQQQSYMRWRWFCESDQLEGKSATSTPCADRAVRADFPSKSCRAPGTDIFRGFKANQMIQVMLVISF